MKYILRFVACIPMIAVGISFVISLVFAFEYPIVVLLTIGNFFAMQVVCAYYEETVEALADFLRKMCDDVKEAD